MIVILGFNAFHADSAACLVVDGQLVGAVAEERLGERQKHSPAFPAQAIRRLLADAGLRLRDVTHVALGAPRRRGDPLTQREMDIARSTQVRFEEAAIHCLTRLHMWLRSVPNGASVCRR